MTNPLTAIPKGFGSGGAGLSPNGGGSSSKAGSKPTLEQLLNEHRAAILALQGEGADTTPVRFATTANLNLATTGLAAIDGVTPVAGNLALVKDETSAASNDIYVVSAGAWVRATDDAGNSLLKEGAVVSVAEGTTNGGKLFVLGADLTTWTAGTTASLSAATPAQVAAVGAAGSAGTASKSDHAHADPNRAPAGVGLTDTATQTINLAGGTWRKLAALGQGGALTLDTAGAIAGSQIEVTRLSTDAFAYAIIDGGPGTPTLVTLPASKVSSAKFQFDGTNWALRSVGQLA